MSNFLFRRHAQLTRLSHQLVDALTLYHTLMRDMPPAPSYGGFPQQPGMYGMGPMGPTSAPPMDNYAPGPAVNYLPNGDTGQPYQNGQAIYSQNSQPAYPGGQTAYPNSQPTYQNGSIPYQQQPEWT